VAREPVVVVENEMKVLPEELCPLLSPEVLLGLAPKKIEPGVPEEEVLVFIVPVEMAELEEEPEDIYMLPAMPDPPVAYELMPDSEMGPPATTDTEPATSLVVVP